MSQRPRTPKHVDISVRDRLLTLAKRDGQDYNSILNLYFRERLLARLALSPHREQFVLKGGALLWAFAMQGERGLTRPTKDLDFRAGSIANSIETISATFAEICAVRLDEDGVLFDAGGLVSERIAEIAIYPGVRLSIPTKLASVASRIQIDVGFGDVITPVPLELEFPVLLEGMSVPTVLAYSRETIVAEKYEAMLKLSFANTRMKDFFDVYQLAHAYAFNGPVLCEAIQRTAERREMPFLAHPAVLQPEFGMDAARQQQWSAFLVSPKKWHLFAPYHLSLKQAVNQCLYGRVICSVWSTIAASLGCGAICSLGILPHTVTSCPSRSPSHSLTVQARRSRFFQSWALAKVSSSALNRLNTEREATRIILRLARLSATVRRRGSSRNSLDASR